MVFSEAVINIGKEEERDRCDSPRLIAHEAEVKLIVVPDIIVMLATRQLKPWKLAFAFMLYMFKFPD